MKLSRRRLMQTAGVAAFAPLPSPAAAMPENRFEGPATPKIGLAIGDGGGGFGAAGRGRGGANAPEAAATPASAPGVPPLPTGIEGQARRLRQIGVEWCLSGGPRMPWTEDALKAQISTLKGYGITLGNLMISGFDNAIYNRPGKDQDIEKFIASVEAAGKAGLPVVEYNWYAHRAMEGYFEEEGRAGSGWTGFDYELTQSAAQQYQTHPEEKGIKFKDLPALPNEGAHTLDEMWANITYFLKAVVPAAEKAGVRLALHPNDPPAPVSRKSQQIMGTVDGWKHLIEIVKSPSNGITFDCGVTREMGQDPIDVCAYFASRDRINHVHYRNVKVIKPYERYSEVWIDEGMNNMFAIMRELIKHKYTRMMYPEHPRALDYDRERGRIGGYPGGGSYTAYAYNVGYARAMMQAALTVA